MKSIRIKNLRSLRDTGEIDLKPLTVLVGKNSSGKSTFLRFFPLLKQTLETRINEPVLWYSSRYVDFGSFTESLNRKDDSQLINFSFRFDVDPFMMIKNHVISRRNGFIYTNTYMFDKISKQDHQKQDCYISIEFGKTDIESLYFECANQKISIKTSKTHKGFIDLELNGKKIANKFFMDETEVGKIIPQLYVKVSENKFTLSDEYFRRELFTLFKEMAYQSTIDETIEEYIFVRFGSPEQLLKNLKDKKSKAQVLHTNVKNLKINDKKFIEINNNYVGFYLNELISITNKYLNQYFTSVKYIAPLRASAERYYRIQGISLNEVDPQGENIPMLLQNMNPDEKKDFDSWVLENFKFKITSNLEGGHSSLKIEYENGYEVNLADTGFGYSQILPILIILWQANEFNNTNNSREKKQWTFLERDYDKILNIIIEQPELHLHPALQAMLIDSFVRIINLCENQKINVSIILETHSETIINRIGYLIAKGFEGFSGEKVNVLILDNSKDNYDTKIQSTTYSKEGFLKEWPFGFFSPEEI